MYIKSIQAIHTSGACVYVSHIRLHLPNSNKRNSPTKNLLIAYVHIKNASLKCDASIQNDVLNLQIGCNYRLHALYSNCTESHTVNFRACVLIPYNKFRRASRIQLNPFLTQSIGKLCNYCMQEIFLRVIKPCPE